MFIKVCNRLSAAKMWDICSFLPVVLWFEPNVTVGGSRHDLFQIPGDSVAPSVCAPGHAGYWAGLDGFVTTWTLFYEGDKTYYHPNWVGLLRVSPSVLWAVGLLSIGKIQHTCYNCVMVIYQTLELGFWSPNDAECWMNIQLLISPEWNSW